MPDVPSDAPAAPAAPPPPTPRRPPADAGQPIGVASVPDGPSGKGTSVDDRARASVDEILDADRTNDDRAAGGDRAPLIATAILDFVGQVPATEERRHPSPEARARRLGNMAAARAAVAAGTLSLPPGVLGWLTLLPELRAVWQQQAQMVADIAGIYGRHHDLSREVMLYCLFRHIAPVAFRSLVRREGEAFVVGRPSSQVFGAIAAKIATRVSLRLVGRGASRWLPVVGAVGNSGFAFIDTGRVAKTAIELFSNPVVLAGNPYRKRPDR